MKKISAPSDHKHNLRSSSSTWLREEPIFGKGGLGNLTKRAQQTQEKIQKMQEEIAQLEVADESGTGLVKVTINDTYNCRRIKVDPSLLKDDKKMLEDLVAVVFDDVARHIEETQKGKMASVPSGVQLPPGFKMLF